MVPYTVFDATYILVYFIPEGYRMYRRDSSVTKIGTNGIENVYFAQITLSENGNDRNVSSLNIINK